MPELTARAHEVLTKAQQLQAVEKARQAEGQLAQRRSALRALQERLQEARDFESEWSTAGLPSWTDESSRSLLRRARERVEVMRRQHEADPTALLDDGSFRILARSIEAAATAAAAAAAAAWAHYSQQVLPPPLGEDEELLRADPRLDSQVVDRLLTWDRYLRNVSAKPRPTPADLREFMQVIAKRKELWASIVIEQEPEVVEFIRASGDQGASLRLLTDKVAAWLNERGLFDAYVIRKRA
jgi:hypothetical protein